MAISEQNLEIRNRILELDRRVEEMHQEFQKYCVAENPRAPDWQGLEREFLSFSRRRIYDLTLSKNLERVMYKFQNRKRIWLDWIAKVHQGDGKP